MKNFKMGTFATIFQWLCVILLFVVMFWDSEFSFFINQHLVFTGLILVFLAIIANALDYFLRIRKDEKERLKKSDEINKQ